jgi:hypothetical protein
MVAFDSFLLDQVGQNRFGIKGHQYHLQIIYHEPVRGVEAIKTRIFHHEDAKYTKFLVGCAPRTMSNIHGVWFLTPRLRVFADDSLDQSTLRELRALRGEQSKSLNTIDTDSATSIRYVTTIPGGL